MNEGDQKSPPSSSNMGSTIALGAGIGLIFGHFIFGNAGIGLTIGAGLGVAFASLTKAK